jgi:DNA-binding CsgD family transcriptional regulator
MRMLKELVEFNIHELNNEERPRTSYCWNHRIRRGDGTWINLMNNLTPVVFDENGKPMVSLGFYTKIGEGEKQPLKLFVRQLNDHDEYETLWQKNYSHQRLIDPLSNRERDIAMMMAQGKSSKEIGEKLFISSHTVDTHRRNILKKLSLGSTTELITNFRDVLY